MFSVVLYCGIWAEQRFVSVHWLYHSQMNSAVMSAKWRVGSSTIQSGPGKANLSELWKTSAAFRGLLNPGKGHLKIVGKLFGVFTCPFSTLSPSRHSPWRWQQPDPNLGLWMLTVSSARPWRVGAELTCGESFLSVYPVWGLLQGLPQLACLSLT